MFKSSIFKITFAFIIGILLAYLLPIHWIFIFTLWATSLVALIVLVATGRKVHFYRKWISVNIIIVFMLSGSLGYIFNAPRSFTHYFTKSFLPNDQITGKVIDFQKGKNAYDKVVLEIESVVTPYTTEKAQGRLLCYIKSNEQHVQQGSVLLIKPQIQAIQNSNNPGEFDAELYWKSKGIEYITFLNPKGYEVIDQNHSFSNFWERSRNHLIGIVKTHISDEYQGLVVALALGDKSNLSNERRNQFANAGAMHVLAVSGLHVGILLGFLYWIFGRFKFLRKRNLYIIIALILIWCFAFLTGLSASVTRATTMFTILSVGQLLGKKFFSLKAVFASALFLLLINPLYLFDIGFQLSYLAILGISLFFNPIRKLISSKYKVINFFWEGTAIGIAAQIGTIPISLYYFHQFPNYFIITNIGLLVMSSIALISVVVFLIFCFVPYLVDILSWIVNFIFHCLTVFIAWIDRLPFSVSTGFSPSLTHVLFMYIFIGLVYYAWQNGNVRMLKVGSVVLFLLGILLIYNREIIKTEDTLIVLNDSNKSVLVKEDGMLYFIHQKDADITQKSIHYLISGYEKSVGLHADIISLSQNKAVNISPQIRIKNTHNGWRMKYFDQHLLLANRLPKTKESSSLKLVKGKWNRFINNEKVDYNTTNKALQIYPTYK